MLPLSGKRVAVLESRMADQVERMVARLGGTAVCAPAVREIRQPREIDRFVRNVATRRYRCIVFLTGSGAEALIGGANDAHSLNRVRDALNANGVVVAARGPKPLRVLSRHGIDVRVTTRAPHTTREVLDALQEVPLSRARTLLVHYGERNTESGEALRERGAEVEEVCPYVWAMPEDPSGLTRLVEQIVGGTIDALLLTSQVQCRHLFAAAAEIGAAERLTERLGNHGTIVGAVGPVCASALRQAGAVPDIMPARPNLPSLISAIADYFTFTRSSLRPPVPPPIA